MRVEFLPEEALRVGKAPIIADIRIGFEVAMAREGTYVPRMLNRIMEELVRRNHDVGVLWLSELGVEIVDSLNLAGWTVVHGHRLGGGGVHNWVRTPSNKAGG